MSATKKPMNQALSRMLDLRTLQKQKTQTTSCDINYRTQCPFQTLNYLENFHGGGKLVIDVPLPPKANKTHKKSVKVHINNFPVK